MTSLAEEALEQRRWHLRSPTDRPSVFDKLLANEFRSPREQREYEAAALSRFLRFSADRVPYYADILAQRGLTTTDIRTPADLPRLPVLTKEQVRGNWARLIATGMSPDDMKSYAESSGTTGQPLRVLFSRASARMFALLKQRELRWFRFDPKSTCASIRAVGGLAPGETLKFERWPHVGRYFETGPFFALNVTSPIDVQVEWIERQAPDYFVALAASLEHLALAFRGRARLGSLRALQSISQEMTPQMRTHIETVFGVPVHQNYGLNEFGIVASRCEAGRYHVHTEHCLVEIVDEVDRPSAPGAQGRILVTSLTNSTMPLIRYDTDDLAYAVEGPCPCGRVLPGFGLVTGRYSRIAFLPPGVFNCVLALRAAMAALPVGLATSLRQFQIHHRRDNSFLMRLAIEAPIPDQLVAHIRSAWMAVAPGDWLLALRRVDQIQRGNGAKFEAFTSEFFPSRGER